MSDWRPAETAPKDGTKFIAWMNHGEPSIIWHDPVYEFPWTDGVDFYTNHAFRGWLSIPEPPEQTP